MNRKAFRPVRFLCAALLLAGLSACGSGGGSGGEEEGDGDEGGSADAPHALTASWIVDDGHSPFHGTSVTSSCYECHSAATDCSRCHFGPSGSRVPQGVTWVHGTVPHDTLAAYGSICGGCHDLMNAAGKGPQGCTGCHGMTPNHPTGQAWLDKAQPTFHGDVAAADPTPCAGCHGADYRGGGTGVSCYDCHFGPNGSRVPPGSGWTHGRSGHTRWGSQSDACIACHDLNRSYGHPPTCHNCH